MKWLPTVESTLAVSVRSKARISSGCLFAFESQTCKCVFRITCPWVGCACVCPVNEGGMKTKRTGVRQGRTWSHNTPTANNRETKLLVWPIQTHSHHMTTLLWQRETVSVCMSVLLVGWGGHLGFLQRVKQTEWGRFTSPLGQTDNIDTVCHNKRQTEPKCLTCSDKLRKVWVHVTFCSQNVFSL